MADEKQAMVEKARGAFGLKPTEVFTSSVREGVVTIVTVGGFKAAWREGDKAQLLNNLRAGRELQRGECAHCGEKHDTAEHGLKK